jgi:hypothetical protein
VFGPDTRLDSSTLRSPKASPLGSDGTRWRARAYVGVVWNELGHIVVRSPIVEPANPQCSGIETTRSRLILRDEVCSSGACLNVHQDLHHAA